LLPAALVLVTILAGAGATIESGADPGAASDPAPSLFAWNLPPGFPPPAVPDDNPMSAAKVELGRRLFYDTRLSGNGAQSCATCHRQRLAFTDGRPRAVGSTGAIHPRSAMSLANVAYNVAFTWENADLRRLEDQALVPMIGEHPVEMGLTGREDELAARLSAEPLYAGMFRSAFPGDPKPVTIGNVARALACFERTLISGNSPYDRLVYRGEMDALSAAAWRGMRLFFSRRLACSECHSGINFSGPIVFQGAGGPVKPRYHNTGLYDLDGRGSYPSFDRGLMDATHRRRDMGRFRVPTLRNIALTAPYMHDGSVATLGEAIDHYAAGGRAGRRSRYKDALIHGFALEGSEKKDLVAFLESLTDEEFVADPRFADPWTPDSPNGS
jgi:cytochrome c peroxidase